MSKQNECPTCGKTEYTGTDCNYCGTWHDPETGESWVPELVQRLRELGAEYNQAILPPVSVYKKLDAMGQAIQLALELQPKAVELTPEEEADCEAGMERMRFKPVESPQVLTTNTGGLQAGADEARRERQTKETKL